MTNGSSQGLFVIVAVVIFGIFVVISYLLFRDKLQTGLASIFSDSISEATNNLTDFKKVTNFLTYSSDMSYDSSTGVYTIKPYNNPASTNTERYPIGLRNAEEIEIPWGYKLIYSFDIYYVNDLTLTSAIDFNAYPVESITAWKGNDNYGSTSVPSGESMYAYSQLSPNKWNTVQYSYSNDNSLNINKDSIFDGIKINGSATGTVFGIQRKQLLDNSITEYKLKNIKYKVVKI